MVGNGKGGRGDLTIFVMGYLNLIELKSNAADSIIDKKQYRKDRDPKELILNINKDV